MKKIIAVGSFFAAILFLLELSIATISCNKPTDCKGQVTVVDSLNQVINGAKVTLYSKKPVGQITAIATTGMNGIANFDLKLPAILDISVAGQISNTKGTKDSVHGTGVIQLQADETGYTTVTAK